MPLGWIAAGTVVTGYLQSEAIKDSGDAAAASQDRSAELGIAENRRQFDKLQALLKPYVEGGGSAFTAQQDLIGLNGPEAEEKAIAALEGSPRFDAIVKQGEAGILANASATGGLRGGDVEGALAQFRPQVLSQLIEDRYNKLGGIAGIGQASAAGVGAAGIQTGNSVAQLLQDSGEAQAQAALLSGAATANAWGNAGRAFGIVAGGKF